MENSLKGWTREELYKDTEPPAWFREAEALYGPLYKTSAMQMPDGRQIILAKFARVWRLSLINPQNEEGKDQIDVFLRPETMESIVFLEAMLHDGPRDPERPFPTLQSLIDAHGVEHGSGAHDHR